MRIKNLDLGGWEKVIDFALIIIIAFLAGWILRIITRSFFRRLQKERKNLNLTFLEKLIEVLIVVAIIILAISAFSGAKTIWGTLLGGTAVVSAVIAFAAQDVIKDVLAGLMISVYKPFEIGNRIELEDGTAGIVEDITMRHVVLVGIDNAREIIPNSRLNAMKMTNYSYHTHLRSCLFRFSVSYDTNTDLAKEVIAKAIEESPHSVPVKTLADGTQAYSPVYFLQFADSALIMAVTVYYEKTSKTEIVKDDINSRVRRALNEAGIEIPYNYVTVVNKEK